MSSIQFNTTHLFLSSVVSTLRTFPAALYIVLLVMQVGWQRYCLNSIFESVWNPYGGYALSTNDRLPTRIGLYAYQDFDFDHDTVRTCKFYLNSTKYTTIGWLVLDDTEIYGATWMSPCCWEQPSTISRPTCRQTAAGYVNFTTWSSAVQVVFNIWYVLVSSPLQHFGDELDTGMARNKRYSH